ncbi:biosynthetic arginine decarboxylase [Oceanospirillum linum]|uniref:Biosynthetic arginine decarboxylase n=1 Tax=Oceanospirillum linum TaxID=966 RepID=A0A1T1H8U6_OCELI|nr:biosynthetic arginine decarboxylase [Oceanospirillum linum]OOV86258.1 arginine decarboxylase [Oceanospirillum linum]SEG39379.1 arginine decarboxylase [Oleiphilus messinensis]SMP31524.1 arginine decarboxylase [Oceanospirillum linum]
MTDWSLEDAFRTYNIDHWGSDYFAVNPEGRVVVKPSPTQPDASVDLTQLCQTLQAQGLSLPVLVRFTDILHHRVNRLCAAFDKAMQELEYTGGYTAVYPIKVNQQRRVVEEILNTSARSANRVGLEAGSKPELLAVLAQTGQQNSVIVCNGYKDREYVRLALLGEKLGHKVFIVIEKMNELNLVLEESKKMGVKPRMGIRARLASIGKGNWQNTGGEKSKFGLSASQILQVVEQLKRADALDTLQLLHFHLGSQIANIRDIQRGLKECGRFYNELCNLGANIGFVDVGGGLGVDYEGTRSRSICSINYSMEEYANNVVHAINEVCSNHNLPYPHLITESGRAITAHHAVLITDVIDIESPDTRAPDNISDDEPAVIQELWRAFQLVTQGADERSLVESYHDVVQAVSEAQDMYTLGILTLTQRSLAERIYTATCDKLRGQLNTRNRAHRTILDELNEKLADKLFANFSLFQSLPDVWGIEQIFPILPLSQLHQPPLRRGVIQDITCDSDGRIDLYVDGQGLETTLPLPAWPENEQRLLGVFLVGAYQEILGDMHNLFGDTDSVDVTVNAGGDVQINQVIKGDTVAKVLEYVNFDPNKLMDSYRAKMDASDLTDAEQACFIKELEEGLAGYTYLE